ncbi:MAG: hypothetical protein H0T92_19505 [Pyrinomonadaceae bacterium]|nr:hypothetical protein [Pyrinomonadaceae bacterium]
MSMKKFFLLLILILFFGSNVAQAQDPTNTRTDGLANTRTNGHSDADSAGYTAVWADIHREHIRRSQ